MAALFIGLMALMPVQAITQEEMVYDQVSKYIRGSEAAAIARISVMHPIRMTSTRSSSPPSLRQKAISIILPCPAPVPSALPSLCRLQRHHSRSIPTTAGRTSLAASVPPARWSNATAHGTGPSSMPKRHIMPDRAPSTGPEACRIITETMNYVQTVEQTRGEIYALPVMKPWP